MAGATAAVVALVSCSGEKGDPPAHAGVGDAPLGPVETLVTTGSGLVGNPTDLDVGPDGTLYVLDGLNARVHRIGPGGEHLGSFGSRGQGPTELMRPRTVAVGRGDTVWVVDGGNGRLQAYLADGEHVGSWPAPPAAATYPSHVGLDGTLVVATLGLDTARAAVHDRDGTRLARLGTPPMTLSPGVIDMGAIKEEIADGGVPDLFRNTAWPTVGRSGDIWLSIPADAVIERYSPGGELLDSIVVDDPTFGAIEADFRARNADPGFRNIYPLRFMQDLYPAGGELWVLLNPAGDGPTVVHRYGEDGARRARYVIDAVRAPTVLAADPARGALYLGVAETAEILSVALEGGG